MNDKQLNKLIAHLYIYTGLLMGYFAIPQAIPFSDQYGSYCAVVFWTLFIPLYVLYRNRKTVIEIE